MQSSNVCLQGFYNILITKAVHVRYFWLQSKHFQYIQYSSNLHIYNFLFIKKKKKDHTIKDALWACAASTFIQK